MVALLVVLPLAAAPVPSAQGATLYTITGQGFGHGVGMSQYGAYGYARHGFRFRSILAHYYTGTTLTAVRNVTLRVLLRDGASRIAVTSATRIALYDESTGRRTNLSAGNVFRITPSYGRYRVTNTSTGALVGSFRGPIRLLPSSAPIRMLTSNANGQTRVTYRGWLRVLNRFGTLRVVNYVPLESYLRGVVPSEMPSSWHMEALKTQSVAARSFAIASRRPTAAFDLYSTVQSQYYGGIPSESARANAAISTTAGLALKYGSSIIRAYFHSTSGGRTENNENVWGGSPLGWARSVSDPYDTLSPYHYWPENPIRLTPRSLAARLGRWSTSNRSGVKGSLRSVVVTSVGASPRARRLTISGSGGTSYISGNDFRSKLRLRSTWFSTLRGMSIATTTTMIRYGQTLKLFIQSTPVPPGRRLALRTKAIGAARWTPVTVITSSSGAYSRWIAPTAGTSYQAAVGWAISPTRTVKVRALVSLAASSYAPKLGTAVRLSGKVSPNHAGKLVSVMSYTSRGWRTFASARLGKWSNYSVAFKPSRRGAYYFSTLFPSDRDHVGNVSRVRTVVVK